MSDEESEVLSAEVIAENLVKAVDDLKETKDYLTYATLLDVYLSNPSTFTDDEKRLILKTLNKILTENLDIVYEIGWDLPELLLGFFNLERDYTEGALRDTDLVKLIMALFDILARNGNAKELFIKSIELLTSLDLDFDQSDENEGIRLDLKIHTLIELLSASLKRINTIYPSKFLAMSVSALLTLLSNYIKSDLRPRFITRRLYSFAREYLPPLKPKNYLEEHGINQEEASKIDDDENYLQRQLLQSFITNLGGLNFTSSSLEVSLKLYHDLQLINKGIRLPIVEQGEAVTSTSDLFVRIVNLSLSFDFDFDQELENIKKGSVELLDRLDTTKSEDDQIQDLLKFSINDKVSNLFNPESKTIPKNLTGLLYYISLNSWESRHFSSINIKEAIAITIRFLSPSLLSEKFLNLGTVDASYYWIWISLLKAKKEDFTKISHPQLILFLQIIIFLASTIKDSRYRFVSYTILTRVLGLIDEETAYNFLVDTLTTAPFPNVKAAVTNILKDLILRERPSNIDDVTSDLKETSLTGSSSNETITSTAPKLPVRYYIQLNKDRIEDIYALVRESIDEVDEQTIGDDKVVLGYLNFIIGIRNKFPKDKIKEIINVTNAKIQNADNVEFLKIAIESLEDFLAN